MFKTNKETLELFERAFTKDCQRPSAYEWQEHLWKLMHGLKQCKNNSNHVYFTSKGCGLCSVENKFYKDLNNIKQQKQVPEKIRGIEISQLSTEKVKEEKIKKYNQNIKMQRMFVGGLIFYLVFFASLYKVLFPVKSFIKNVSLGFQGLIIIFILMGISKFLRICSKKIEHLTSKVLRETLLVYAFICMIMIMVLLNDIPRELFSLAD